MKTLLISSLLGCVAARQRMAALFLVCALVTTASASTNIVSGLINVPGERDVYTFSLATNARWYFDSLVNNGNLQWTLRGPQWTLVANRAFNGSDAQSVNSPVLSLPAADYTLTIESSAGTTNAYSFRFVNFVDATLLVPGSTVSGSLSPAAETDFYQFTAAAGDRFVFDQLTRVSLPNAYWRLIDPYGNETFSQGFTDVGTVVSPVTLPQAGTYTLLVEGYIGDVGSGTYSFNVSPQGTTPPVPFTGTPLVLGSMVISNLVANTTNSYVFTLAAPTRIVFDNQTNSPNLNWTLEGPSGLIINQRGIVNSDGPNGTSLLDLPAGNFLLRVRGNANNSYRFRLLDLATATPLTPGSTVSGQLQPATETKLYRFNGTAGARLFFDNLTVSGAPNSYWKLVDPFGGVVFIANLATDQGPITLGGTGIYTLLVEGYYFDAGNGSFSFDVLPVADNSQVLTLGDLTIGTVATPGQRQLYSFTLPAAARLHFDSRTNNSSLRWSLDGPTGNVVNSRNFNGSDGINFGSPILNLGAGDYTLSVFGPGDNTGGYRFRLFDLATAAPLTLGTPINNTLSPANETDAYQFTLATSGKFFFDFQSASGIPNASQRLIGSFGNFYINTSGNGDVGPFTLPAGTYVYLLEGYHSDLGNGSYTFNLIPVTDATQPLVLGTVVNGAITSPGQLQRYTFNLASAARLHFDSRTNNNLRWSLDGSVGNVINIRSFNSSDSVNNGNPLLNLVAGDYTLTVSGSADATGNFHFRLFDVATATPMTPGTPVSGSLIPATASAAYKFTLGAAGRFFYDPQTISGLANCSVRLIDAFGNFYINGNVGSDIGPFNLPAGDYVLMIEGYHSDLGNGNYTFNLAPVNDGTQNLVLGNVIVGNVAIPGQAQRYNFTLGAAARLHFDSQTNNGALRWSLDGPAGNFVNNRTFTGSDSVNFGNPVLYLPAGNYTLTVSGSADTVGGYQFRLVDLATVPALIPGTPISNTLSPASETDVYQFTVATPGRYFYEAQSVTTLPNAQVRLLDDYGDFFLNNNIATDAGPVFLPAGHYTLFLEGYYGDANSGSYTINVVPVNDGTQALTLGSTVNGNINTPGQSQLYTFTLGASARLYFDSLLNSSVLRWSLDGPVGNVVNNRTFSGSDAQSVGNPLLPLAPGNYTLTVSGSGDATGAFQFRLLDLAASTVLTPGTPVSVVNSTANQTTPYRFTAAAGDRFYFDYQTSASLPNAWWRLVDPFNNILFSQGFNDAGTNTLSAAGTYVVLVEGYIGDPNLGSYTFNVRPEGNVPPVPFTGTPLTLGATNIGTLATAAATDAYTFNLGAPSRLYFDALVNGNFLWTLRGPGGLWVNNRNFLSSDHLDISNPLLDLPAGDYQITVTGTAGAYQFRLVDFASAVVFTPGNIVSNVLAPSRTVALYKFTGSVGQRLFFDGQLSSGFTYAPYVRLYGPLGNLITGQNVNADVDTFTLSQAGTYTVLVEGRIYDNSASGTYAFNFQPVTDGTNALVFGSTVVGAASTVGERQYYTFTLATPRKLYFDALTNVDFYWRLDAPWGQIVNWRAFNASDSVDFGNPLLDLPAGTYTLGIAANNFAFPGGYQFRVLDFASASAFTPGTVVSNTLNPTRLTMLYQFIGAAGDRMYFDGRPNSGFQYQPYVRIYSPQGGIIFAQYANSDFGPFTLPLAGTYTIAVEGRIYDVNASGNYSFNLQPVVDGTNALAFGATINSSIATVGQVQRYTFNLATPHQLYFDVLTNADFYWRLDAPWGAVVDWRYFLSSDGPDFANPMLALPAGNFTLSVAANNFAFTGEAPFRLLDFASATLFTPGTIVSNALTPTRAAVLYQFNGTAGQKFFFDGLPSSGFQYQPYVRIYAPLGNIILAQNVNADVDTFSLPQTGTYFLTVEGRVYDNNATGNYAFTLTPVSYPTNVLTVGAVTAGSITTLGQRHYYTLNLAAPANLFFDSLTNRDFYWRLDAPWGQVVDWRSFAGSDGADFANPMMALPPGSYLMTVAASSFSFTGDYRFRLLNSANAIAFTPGNVVSNALAPANSTVFYQFNGVAGDRYYFDGQPSSGFQYQPNARLYAPLGNIILNRDVNADMDTFALPQTGLYTLALEGRVYDFNATGNYAFNLVPNPITPSQPLFETNAAADLIVSGITLTPPSGVQSGESPTVNWTVQNIGGVATSGNFTDRVTIRNVATGQIIANSTLLYNEAAGGNGSILPGGSRSRQLVVALPDGSNSVGTLEITVTTDTLNNILEQNTGGSAEANNSTTFNFNTTLAPYPDLLVHSVTTTPITGWLPNSNVIVQWRITNAGPRAANGNWTDSVVIRNTNTAQVILNGATNYVLADAGNGPIAPGGFRDRALTFTVPNNGNAYGVFEIIVTADSASQVFELIPGFNAETNNSRTLVTISAPDLVISNVVVNGSPSLQSGASVTVQWNVLNEGNVDTGSSFYDRVRVRNTNTSEVLVDAVVFYNPGAVGSGDIPPDGSRARSYNFTLPNGPRSVGALEVTVTADTFNNLFEGNATGTGEANNPTSVLVGSGLAPYPDLRVVNLSVQPATIASGTNLTIFWAVTNSGAFPAINAWYDRVLIVNTNLGVTLLDANVYFDTGGPGPLTNGTARNRSYDFTLPNNVNGSGGLLVSVTADRFDHVFEYNGAGTGESNNTTSLSLTSGFSPLPDLAVHDIIAPSSAMAGQTISLVYVMTNRGTATAIGPWFDTIYLSADAAIGSDSPILNSFVAGSIPAGGSITRTQAVTVPINGDAGTLHFVVQADSGNSISELIENNNALLDADNFSVPLALQLTLNATQIAEDAVNPNVTATLTRNGSAASALAVSVLSSDTSEMIVPATVNIPANFASLTFQATVQQDGLYDGPQTVSIQASAAGFTGASANITVVDANIPRLTFSLSTNRLVEGGAGLTATVTREPVTSTNLVVQLTSVDSAQISFPATVTVLANVATATFTVSAVNDLLIERTNTYSFSGNAAGFVAGTASVTVEDDDIPSVTITLAAHTVSEGAGANATSATLTRNPVTAQPVVVQLVSGNPAAAQVPSFVTIPANQANISFSVAAINNTLVDGNKNAVITGFVLDSTTSQRLREATPDALTVTDDDGPTLTLVIATDVVGEGLNPATTAIVTRNAGTNVDLLVTLASSDTTEATAPVSVHIPVGSYSTNFPIASVADGVTDGNQTVTFTAAAAGFTSGSDTLVVSDTDLPDLVVTSISFVTNGITDQNVAVTFRVENRGLKAVTNAFVQRVYLSTDPYVGGDVLASQLDFSGTLDVGQFFSQTVSLRMPTTPGERWVVVDTDAAGAVTELLENNNALVSTNRIIVAPAYTAIAQTDVGAVLANTSIPIYGQATLAGGGVAANVPLTLHIEVRGVRRAFSIFAGPDGRFTNVFHPLPNEAGVYHIAAAYPGVVNPPTQDTFSLIGMSIAPVGLVNVIEEGSLTNSTRIENLSDVPLTALSVVVVTNQPNLTVNASLRTNTLDGFASTSLEFTISAANAVIFQSPVIFRVMSAEGAVAEVTLTVRVEALLPRLVVTPGSLRAAMLRGGQTSVPFTIANQGGLATGPLEILLPNEPWLSLASPAAMPALPPGTNTSATLLLTPAANLPLGDYNGNIVVRSTNAAISIPFSFRAVSDAKGSLLLTAEDEYTYFAAGNPKVTNATIILSDALSGLPVVTNYTAADGTFLFTNLTEAFYIVDVRADGHSPFRETALVAGGQTTNVTAFLTRQTVRYSFTVVPTTIEDRYIFQVDSTFETQVPVPVCTISPASLDLAPYSGNEFQIEFTVANHGLIAAENVALNIPNTDRLQFTALITNIGRLAPNTSLTIPVLVRRIAAPLKSLSTAFGSGQCSVTAGMLWDYLCGPNVVDKSTAFYVFDSTGCDLVALYRQVYDLVPTGGGGGGGGGGPVLTSDEFFDYLNQFQIVTDFEAPPGYEFQCKPTRPALVKPPKGGKSALAGTSSVTSTNTEVCARVQIRLDQKAVLARDAFKATLELDNLTATSIGSILVSLEIKDANGALVNSVFGIRPPEFSGLNAVDGSGVVPGNSVGRASWILIPTLDAAPTNGATLYLVGGTLSYVQDGTAVTIPLAPAPIQVLPQPELLVRYFHERDVYADDPFTTEIEPSIPYSLAVQIDNVGHGAARSLKLTSGQPEILDNTKGLLIDYKIIGTQLENQPLTPSLEIDFGRIEPNSNKLARWLFTSTVQGNFTNYAASFQHVDALGNPRLSLVRGTEIHELNHIVQADRTFQDGRPDLLVNDAPDSDRLPDTLYLSDGTIVPVGAVTAASFTGVLSENNLQVSFNASVTPGWNYLRLPNPAGTNGFRLVGVRRADNSVIALGTNAWTTDRIFPGGATRPIRTNLLHLIDFNSTGAYTLLYELSAPPADTTAPSSAVAALPSSSPSQFAVNWSGSDGANGTGIAFYDIFVSVNGGPATNWLPHTTLTGSIFNGVQGASYSFFSVATDSAGNLESAPATPDAQTTANQVNTAPSLSLGTDRTIDEGATLNITPTASDLDSPSQTLTFALLPGAPSGLLFNPANGAMTWPTGEGNGPSTNVIRMRISDNGQPSLSTTSTLTVVVREVNSTPSLLTITNRTISELFVLSFVATVSDQDFPANAISYSLGAGAPTNATINPATGQFSWRPNASQGPSTNVIRVIATDNGSPSLSATQTFTVVVRDSQANYLVAVGSTNVFAGRSNSVPVTVNAGLDLSEIEFHLDASAARLNNLQLGELAGDVTSVTLLPVAGDRSLVRFNLDSSGALATLRTLAKLSFTANTNGPSAILPLVMSDLTAKIPGGANAGLGAGYGGRVIVVGIEPLLTVERTPTPRLTLYGHPGTNYNIESRTNLAGGGAWTPFVSFVLSNEFQSFPVLADKTYAIYRASEAIAGSSRLVAQQNGTAISLLLQGQAGLTYQLQSKTNMASPTWDVVSTFVMTNSTRPFALTNDGARVRFYRMVKP